MARCVDMCLLFFFSSRRRHTRCSRDWSSDVCSSDLGAVQSRASAAVRYLPAQGRKEPEVIEQAGAQIFNDPALDLDPGLQSLVQALEMRLHLRIAGGHAILEPGDVHPGGDQQPAELIVQYA